MGNTMKELVKIYLRLTLLVGFECIYSSLFSQDINQDINTITGKGELVMCLQCMHIINGRQAKCQFISK